MAWPTSAGSLGILIGMDRRQRRAFALQQRQAQAVIESKATPTRARTIEAPQEPEEPPLIVVTRPVTPRPLHVASGS